MSAGPEAEQLQDQATKFASNMTETVRAVVPGASTFRAVALSGKHETRLHVMQDPADGITLCVEGVPMLRLEVSFQCVYDHQQRYLAVADSRISVSATASSEPLLRYEYMRAPTSTMAGAHFQVHAHRDAFTYVMTQCGNGSTRGKRRRAAADDGKRVPQLSDLHLPLGGPRFRPCLEDILQMLVDEMGVDAPPTADAALADGRARWRRMQIGASVRDCPEMAARVLAELGYAVKPPNGVHPPERLDRLTAI